MDFPDKAAACPLIKLVYFSADGELRRVGPKFLLKHYFSTYNSTSIDIRGYSVRGNKRLIEFTKELDFSEEDYDTSLHFALLRLMGYNYI